MNCATPLGRDTGLSILADDDDDAVATLNGFEGTSLGRSKIHDDAEESTGVKYTVTVTNLLGPWLTPGAPFVWQVAKLPHCHPWFCSFLDRTDGLFLNVFDFVP